MIRTQAEIASRIVDLKTLDVFGFEISEYIEFLDFEHAKPYLKEDTTEEQWTSLKPTREVVLAKMKEYLSFAWEKANNCRGISSSRSNSHYRAWIWLLGAEEAEALAIVFNDALYRYYGKPQLVAIAERYGWDWKQHDNDRWTNDETSIGIPAEQATNL